MNKHAYLCNFLCLCHLGLAPQLKCNISKVAYSRWVSDRQKYQSNQSNTDPDPQRNTTISCHTIALKTTLKSESCFVVSSPCRAKATHAMEHQGPIRELSIPKPINLWSQYCCPVNFNCKNFKMTSLIDILFY